MNSTEYDHERWAISQNAQQKFDVLQSGLDISDLDLTSKDIALRYPDDTREVKSIAFSKQPFSDQLEILTAAVTGKKSKVLEGKKINSTSILIVSRINAYLLKLKKSGRLKDWIEKSCNPAIVAKFPLDEQIKYHDAVIKYWNDITGVSSRGSAFPAQDAPVVSDKWEEL